MSSSGIVTFSIDDGHPDDLRLADLLAKYSLTGTFYIPANNPERPLMASRDIQAIGQAYELGAHTYNHKPLVGLSDQELDFEVIAGKTWLEDLLGREVVAFCYPKGRFNAKVVSAAQRAGFVGSRTCMYNLTTYPRHPQCWGVSTQAYSHSRYIQIRHAIREGNWLGLRNFIHGYRLTVDWMEHFRLALDHVSRHGGIAHLYLHSWEISATHQWQRLETLFRDVARRANVSCQTNGDVFQTWRERSPQNTLRLPNAIKNASGGSLPRFMK